VLLIRLFFPNTFLHATTPLFNLSNSFADTSHSFFSSLGDAATCTAQNIELSNEVGALQVENQGLSQKVVELSKLFGKNEEIRPPMEGILAEVVLRPPESPYDTLVVSQGVRAGVTRGMQVLGAGGTPLGVIADTGADFSRVVLFTASGVRTSGWVGRDSVPILLHGAGGGAFTATLARVVDVAVGDSVYVVGSSWSPVGTVARIDSDPSSPSVVVRIVPQANIFSTTHVRIISINTSLLHLFSTASSTPL